MPEGWTRSIVQEGQSLAVALITVAGAVVVGLALYAVVYWVLRRVVRRYPRTFAGVSMKHTPGPARLLFPTLAVAAVLPLLHLAPRVTIVVAKAVSVVTIAAFAWFLIRLTSAAEEMISHRYSIDTPDNLLARKVKTQIDLLRRVAVVVILVVAAASALMVFGRVRQIGTSILASAGIAGIIVGLAAQRSIGNLLAGLQVAFTQPFRIDDVVIVEGEWGRIEEITLTYVVVRIWDERRLVVPVSTFIEKPFQNWSRVSTELLGTVYLYADYRVPVGEVRAAAERFVKDDPLWDGRAAGLQVTGASEHGVEMRALMSAANASDAWTLRCNVRERLVAWLQQHYPESLPRVRAELERSDAARPEAEG